MRQPRQYVAEIERIVGDTNPNDGKVEASIAWDTVEEAREVNKRLALMSKELRLLKKEVRQDMSMIKAGYVSQRSNVQAGAIASIFGGKKGASRDRARKREESKYAEMQALSGHQGVCDMIDELLFNLDQSKHQVAAYIRDAPPEEKRPVKASGAGSRQQDPSVALRQLKQLVDDGLITQEEYEAKKAEVLSRF